jgi:hypothetical protein
MGKGIYRIIKKNKKNCIIIIYYKQCNNFTFAQM